MVSIDNPIHDPFLEVDEVLRDKSYMPKTYHFITCIPMKSLLSQSASYASNGAIVMKFVYAVETHKMHD